MSAAANATQKSLVPRRTLVFAVAIFILHFVCAQALDAAGLIESLLSPSGGRLWWLLPLAIVFYALRVAAYFIVPGLVVASLIEWTMAIVKSRGQSHRPEATP